MTPPGSKDPTVIDFDNRSQTGNPPESKRYPVLVVLEGTAKNTLHVLQKKETLLGRSLDCDLVVEDSLASRVHCRILYANHEMEGVIPDCRVFDQGSTNGTFVNEERVGKDGAWLVDRDRIRIGKTLFGFFIRDEAELKLSSELEQRATRDPLTGLFNRSCFEEVLEQEFRRAGKERLPLSLILVDLDRFKEVNERYGNSCGDTVLKQMGILLNGIRRSGDILARYGGEQFVILMPQTDARGMKKLADRIRAEVENHMFRFEENEIRLTVSVGGTTLQTSTRSKEHFLKKVDSALCSAKRGGRNQVVCDCPPSF